MHGKLQRMILLLFCTSGAGFSQAVHYGVGITDTYCPYCPYDHYGFPCEHRHTVSVLDYPLAEKPKKLEPVKTNPVVDPIQARLEKRMEEIDSAGFANTNKIRIEIVPGLTPQN